MNDGQKKYSINNLFENKSIVNPETETEDQSKLDFDDLLFIVNKSLGLRHVPSEQIAKQEMENGTEGDALAISGAFKLLDEDDLKRLAETIPAFATAQKFKIKTDVLLQNHPETLLDEQAKNQVLNSFNEQLSDFMVLGFGLDINEGYDENKDETVETIINKIIEKSPSFMIVTISGGSGYDDRNYHGLGKSGRGSIESLINYIKLSKEDFSDCNLLPTEGINRTTFNLLCEFMARKMLTKIGLAIKEMKKNNQQ
jgi:hypothetical protein